MTEIIPFKRPKDNVWIRVSDNLMLHKGSGIYYVRKKKAGKRPLFKTTGFNTKGKAQTKAHEMVAQWMGGKLREKRTPFPFVTQVCDELLVSLQAQFENGERRKRTFDQDKTYLKIIKQYFGGFSIDEIDERAWSNWVRQVGKPLNRNLCDIAKYLSKTLTFALSEGYIPRKPKIRNPDKEKKSGMIYENQDIERFIQLSEPMLRDMIIIGAETGDRPHETRGLMWDWISFEETRVIIHFPSDYTKTGTGRSIEVSPNASGCLRMRYLQKNGPYVFPSIKSALKPCNDVHLSRMWRRMLKRAGYLDGLKFQWLRHSFFSKALLDKKLPLAMVAAYGGNSPTTLAKRYLQNDPSRTQELSKVVALNLAPRCEKSVNITKKKD